MTLLDTIIQSLNRAGEYNRDEPVAPAMILWPGKERQWKLLVGTGVPANWVEF